MEWYKYNDGKTIGQKGSENGIIIEDLEHINGARVTVEKGDTLAPYSITVGIYGLMFHTTFSGSLQQAESQAELLRNKVKDLFILLDINVEQRNQAWNEQYEAKMNEIVAV